MRYCDRCEVNPATAKRGDFGFCGTCLPIVKGQEALNAAAVHIGAAESAIKQAQEHIDGRAS